MTKKINYEKLNYNEIISEIVKKKEFSDLPREDVELVYSKFKDEEFVEDRIKKTREMLMKMYTAFVSNKLLNVKDKDVEWFLKRHKSTSERFDYYEDVYRRCLENFSSAVPQTALHCPLPKGHKNLLSQAVRTTKIKREKLSIIDFGCGVNGFSYGYFKKVGFDVNYVGVEPVGQLVDLQNNYFEKNKIFDARCVKASLFDLKKVKGIVEGVKGMKIGFFFKVLDSLEMLKRNYSKEVLKELVPMFDRFIVSWATKSLGDRKRIFANKKWLKEFIDEEFFITDEFEIGGEKYLVFEVMS